MTHSNIGTILNLQRENDDGGWTPGYYNLELMEAELRDVQGGHLPNTCAPHVNCEGFYYVPEFYESGRDAGHTDTKLYAK